MRLSDSAYSGRLLGFEIWECLQLIFLMNLISSPPPVKFKLATDLRHHLQSGHGDPGLLQVFEDC